MRPPVTKTTATNYQDIITLSSGDRIGGYNTERVGDSLYYTRFSDGTRLAIGWDQIARINYVNGTNYEADTKVAPEPEPTGPPVSIHEEGTFLYQLRNVDVSWGLNFTKLSTNTDFINSSLFRWRFGIGVDFFHKNSLITDSTKSIYRANQFFQKANLYLRTELNWTGNGGTFIDRAGFFQQDNVYYYLSYMELACFLQTGWFNDHINFHIGPSFLFKLRESIQFGSGLLQRSKYARFVDVPLNVGVFFRTPRWQQDFKLGLRYSFGLIDVTHNRNQGNIFVDERNFSRNFAIIFKYGI